MGWMSWNFFAEKVNEKELKEMADALGLTGLVRNESNGSVYVEVEGTPESLGTFIEWCHRGPARARVDKCEIQEGSLNGFSRFIIER